LTGEAGFCYSQQAAICFRGEINTQANHSHFSDAFAVNRSESFDSNLLADCWIL